MDFSPVTMLRDINEAIVKDKILKKKRLSSQALNKNKSEMPDDHKPVKQQPGKNRMRSQSFRHSMTHCDPTKVGEALRLSESQPDYQIKVPLKPIQEGLGKEEAVSARSGVRGVPGAQTTDSFGTEAWSANNTLDKDITVTLSQHASNTNVLQQRGQEQPASEIDDIDDEDEEGKEKKETEGSNQQDSDPQVTKNSSEIEEDDDVFPLAESQPLRNH